MKTQIEDLITILDSNGSGTVDYQEFSRWFGAGPPPPPMLPQMKSMQEAQASSSFDASSLLREIEAAGAARCDSRPILDRFSNRFRPFFD